MDSFGPLHGPKYSRDRTTVQATGIVTRWPPVQQPAVIVPITMAALRAEAKKVMGLKIVEVYYPNSTPIKFNQYFNLTLIRSLIAQPMAETSTLICEHRPRTPPAGPESRVRRRRAHL